MNKIILLLTIIYSISLSAQNALIKKTIDTKHIWKNDSADEEVIFYTELPKLENSIYKYHIRYIKQSQILDLYADDSINFSGKVLNFAISLKEKENDYTPKNYIYEIVAINNNDASKIGQLILQNKWYVIPTGKLIKGYENSWQDCSGIDFKYKIDNSFSETSYNCPELQDHSNPEIIPLVSYYQSIDSIISLDKHWNDFVYKLKKGQVYTDGEIGTIYLPTERQIAKIKKTEPKLRYLKDYKSAIDSYLKQLITKTNFNEGLLCIDYVLAFSKKGKLLTVENSSDSKNELCQCRKKIKDIFKNSNLKYLNLKYGFSRRISFSNSQGNLYDPNEYPK